MNIEKYATVKIFPIMVNGSSTGLAPIHVSKAPTTTKLQKNAFFVGENFFTKELGVFRHRVSKNRMAPAIAITPPSLDGIDRKMA